MKIITILGARPQFIKASTVSRALFKTSTDTCQMPNFKELIIHTGQHYDANMSQIFFDELGISEPAHNLGIGGGSHGQNTGRMLEKIEEVLLRECPSLVLVYGDTDSTLAGALAAVKLHIPVAHVEAGLRSGNRRMPEEINRILTDHASDLLFAPTIAAVANLTREGTSGVKVHHVGDVMYDAVLDSVEKAENKSKILKALGLNRREYILATIHRAENTDDPLRLHLIMDALNRVAENLPVILPLHPRTNIKVKALNGYCLSRVKLIPPVGYLDMMLLEKNAAVIATDSGGVQKEAYFHSVPCVTLRDETEWVELIDMNWNVLAPPGKEDIEKFIINSIGRRGCEGKPYGEGNASKKIATTIFHFCLNSG